jgi:hypothetical protein
MVFLDFTYNEHIAFCLIYELATTQFAANFCQLNSYSRA